MLEVSVHPGRHAATITGRGIGACEGMSRSLLLLADPGTPGWLSVEATAAPSGTDAAAAWQMDSPPPAFPPDPLDPLQPDAGDGAGTDRPAVAHPLTFHQARIYEVQAATGRLAEVCEAEFSLTGDEGDVEEELRRKGWRFRDWMRESGLDLVAGAEAFAACPADADLVSVRWYGAAGEQGRLRRQAAAAMPLLAGLIARNPALRSSVDLRRPLQESLRRMFPGLGTGGLRRLGRISSGTAEQGGFAQDFAAAAGADVLGNVRQRRLPLAGGWRTEEVVRWLDGVAAGTGGVDAVPSTNGDWGSCSTIWSGLLMPASTHLGSDIRRISPPGGSWAAMHSALAKDLDWQEDEPPDRRDFNLAVVDAVEITDLLGQDIILPVIHQAVLDAAEERPQASVLQGNARLRACLREAAFDLLIPERSKQPYRAMATLVRRGLTRLARLEGIRRPVNDGGRAPTGQPAGSGAGPARWEREAWEVPYPEGIRASNGATISFIPDRAGLVAESELMQHCIGRFPKYFRSCWNGTGAAAHILPGPDWRGRRRDAARGATVFFDVAENGTVKLSELHGYRNAKVNLNGSPYRDAVLDLEAMQAAGEIRPSPKWAEFRGWTRSDAARALHPDHAAELNRWEEFCGHDPRDTDRTAALWGEWRELVPGCGKVDEPARAVWRSAAARRALEMISPRTYRALAGQARPASADAIREPAAP